MRVIVPRFTPEQLAKWAPGRPAHLASDTTGTETRYRGGRDEHRALCTCGWTSTWQPGPVSMATNAAADHAAKGGK